MKNPVSLLLLLVAVVAPVALFLMLLGEDMNRYAAAALSVATGSLLNFAWALSTLDHNSEERRTVAIAVRYGWVCPTVLITAAAVTQHFVAPSVV